jgi:predicted nucleic acid-binding protein
MTSLIKEKYLLIKRAYTIKLPDAIIAASALAFDMPLITADFGFQKINELKVILHRANAVLADPKKD